MNSDNIIKKDSDEVALKSKSGGNLSVQLINHQMSHMLANSPRMGSKITSAPIDDDEV